MEIWIDQTNCSTLSLLPSKICSSAALEPLDEWLTVSMFIRMPCTMADMAMAAASEMLVWESMAVLKSVVGHLQLSKLLRLIMEKFV